MKITIHQILSNIDALCMNKASITNTHKDVHFITNNLPACL